MSIIIGSEFRKVTTTQTKNNYNDMVIEMQNEFKIKSLYLAKSAHELKNIFLTICSFIENREDSILFNHKNSKENEIEKDSYLNFLKSLCDFGMSLIYEITQISKNDGKFKSIKQYKEEYEEFNLINALNFCVKMFQSRAKFEKKNIEIKLNTNNIPHNKKIKAISEMRLKQVIINLISNSYKFTINGYIELSVEKKDNNIRIIISDSGIGFNEAEMGKIFKPFHMIEKNQFLNKNGSGLGLFICNEILSSNNIKINFSSQRGKGSKFWFDIKDNENIFDPSIFLNDDLKDLMNDINTGLKDLDPNFNNKFTHTIFYDDDELIDDENESIKNLNEENSFKLNFNYQNNIYRKIQSTISLPNNRKYNIHLRMDSNNLTSKTIIKKSNLISKRNIRVVKSLINVNIGKKGHFVRSLSQTELNNSKREKNLFSSNINVNNDNIRIIICDDDSISALSIRKLIIQYFENKNKSLPDIFYVPNGIECLHSAYSFLIEDNPIDVIIMDMNMPFLNGLNTCKLLKNILEMNDIKIFLQSSQDINIKDSGADGFFDKPLSMNHLEEIFYKIIKSKI